MLLYDLDIFCPSVPGTDRGRLLHQRLGELEDARAAGSFPGRVRWVVARHVGEVELGRPVAGELEVLDLVPAHRDQVRAVEQDVRRHQHRVGEEPEVRRDAVGDLVLVAVRPVEVGERDDGPEDPVQLGDLRDVALAEEDGPGRVEPEREEGHRRLAGERRRGDRVPDRGQRVEVGDEVQRLAAVLEIDELADRAVVVADVLLPGGLDAGQDAHGAERRTLTPKTTRIAPFVACPRSRSRRRSSLR